MLQFSSSRLNTLLLVLLILMAAVTISILANRASAGPLDPPGAPAPTLPQVEPRMPIPPVGWNGTFPITISQPGSYFLTGNLTVGGPQGAIVISASGVTLDLDGYRIANAGNNSNTGILGGASVTVRNGRLTNWSYGVNLGNHATVQDIEVDTGTGYGISVLDGSVVKDCQVWGMNFGIATGPNTRVTGCTLTQNNVGVQAGDEATIEDNVVMANTYGVFFADSANVVIARNHVANNAGADIDIGANSQDAIITENELQSCTSVVDGGSGDYYPFHKLSASGSDAVGLVHTNIAHSPNGAGLC